MKQIWPNYSYSPTTNVLTLTGLNIDVDQLLLVSAPERGRIMYNFADSTVTASAFTAGANTGLTLVASTAGLTTTAALVIYYDDQLQSTAITISNFPASQATTFGAVTGSVSVLNFPASQAVTFSAVSVSNFPASQAVTFTDASLTNTQLRASAVTVGGTVTVGNSLTISSLPGVEVTACAALEDGQGLVFGLNRNFPVSGTVTIGAGTAQIGSVTASISGTVPISISSVTIGNSVTIGSLPAISGTVTANLSISSTAITSGSFSSLTSATLVPGNTARKMATVYNLGAGQLFVNQGTSATTLGGGFMVALSSGDFYECNYTTTTLSAIFATAGTASWVSH